MQGKSRCHDHLAPTKQADFIMPSIAEICVPRFFTKDEDFAAFERILHEGLQLHQVQLFSYQLIQITIPRFCVRWLTAK